MEVKEYSQELCDQLSGQSDERWVAMRKHGLNARIHSCSVQEQHDELNDSSPIVQNFRRFERDHNKRLVQKLVSEYLGTCPKAVIDALNHCLCLLLADITYKDSKKEPSYKYADLFYIFGHAASVARWILAFDIHPELSREWRQELTLSLRYVESLPQEREVRAKTSDAVAILKELYAPTIQSNLSAKSMTDIMKELHKYAASKSRIMLLGETGVGKSFLAKRIHDLSKREGNFIPFNCANFSKELIASELFGYVKGAFSSANADHIGLFQAADKGTLFLDEIGELSTTMQAQLLTVMDRGEFMRVGDTKTTKVDVRLISATNRNIDKMVNDGLFRQDLYFRIGQLKVWILPLREDKRSIPALTRKFLKERYPNLRFSDEEIKKLDEWQYDWPGNVRELENAIDLAASSCDRGDGNKHLCLVAADIMKCVQSLDIR